MRNYGAMKPDKLQRCWEELNLREGDAYLRVTSRQEDINEHLAAVSKAMAALDLKTDEVPQAPVTPLARTAPSSFIAPQLAFDGNGTFDVIPFADRDKWIMEPKWDGWRIQIHVALAPGVEESFTVAAYGRTGVRQNHELDAATEAALLAQVPAGTILDGELIWQDASGGHGRTGSRESKTVTFVAFDVLAVTGTAVTAEPWHKRRKLLEQIIDKQSDHLKISPVSTVDETVFAEWRKLGMEGAVLKRTDAPYLPGSRGPRGFVKVKPQSTTEADITGWVYGKGAGNKHLAAAVELRLHNTGAKTSCRVQDLPPEEADALVGRIVEIKHSGWQPSGAVLHPQWGQLRPDLEE